MLYDFGLDKKDMDNSTSVQLKIKEMDQNFELILLFERYLFNVFNQNTFASI